MLNANQKKLGQYFTPGSVIDFALDALEWLSEPGNPEPRSRMVIDPACGDGGFLWRAVDKGLASPCHVFGLDKDEALRQAWALRGSAGGPLLDIGDGLLAETVARQAIAEGGFDWVVGNPPYAGEGLKRIDDAVAETIARRYELCRLRYRRAIPDADRIRKMPIEVLFVERFARLCRPGGHIAIVLPVGLFANRRWLFVREWLMRHTAMRAVVGLPREAFRAGGLTAKTCLAIAQKRPADRDDDVVLAQVEHIGVGSDQRNDLPRLLGAWRRGEQMASEDRPWVRD